MMAAPKATAPKAGTPELRLRDLGEMGGRWIYLDRDEVRHDPLGSCSVVYGTEAEVVASSTAVIPPDLLRRDAGLEAAFDLPEKDGWYPFGLTPYANVRRLLPNHVLRLGSLTPVRVPAPGVENRDGQDGQALDTIARNLREQLQALAAANLLTVGLTAGNETRMLLAGLRGATDAALFFTLHTAGIEHARARQLDVYAGCRLAEQFGLDHVVIPRLRSAEAERLWFERTGRCVSGGPLNKSVSKRILPPERVDVRGLGGEVGRAYYYRLGDRPDTALPVETLTTRLGLPRHEAVLRAGREWVGSAEVRDAYDLLDLLYLENRVGCWASTHALGDVTTQTCIWPLNQASTVRAMRSLSYEAKTQDRMGPLVVKRLWPELLDVPINTPFGLYRGEQAAKALTQRLRDLPRRVGRRILSRATR